MERVFRHFQDDLDALKERLLAMGGLAEERVRESVRGLMERDHAALDAVLAGDEPINDLHMEVDDRCFKLLALHQPMAADLRVIVAAVKINTDLERVGDLAVNIAEAGKRYLGGDKPGWWAVGIIFHLANGALLGLLYTATLRPALMSVLDDSLISGVVGGLLYGVLVWLILMNLIVFPLSGAGVFGRNAGDSRLLVVTLLLHCAFGVALGAIVRP
jgi:hypothetical protein